MEALVKIVEVLWFDAEYDGYGHDVTITDCFFLLHPRNGGKILKYWGRRVLEVPSTSPLAPPCPTLGYFTGTV